MNFKLSELLSIYKPNQLNEFIKMYSNYTLEENGLVYDDISDNWSYVGDTPFNLSAINLLKDPGKGLIERITNGIDAVLEKEKEKYKIENPKSADDIIKVAYPNYYENRKKIKSGEATRQNACEANDKVMVAINDSVQSNLPTIDVIDQGCGISGERFADTILSLHKGNKSKTDKNYLIGAFGQGGSTSLPFSFATIILSKYDNKYYFTIVKRVRFDDMKMDCYVYFTPNQQVPCIIADEYEYKSEYLQKFLDSESGTLIRMIDAEIPREYRANDISKPGMLGDFVNTELYNVSLPVKMIENRANYTENTHAQNRNSFGSFYKMQTWEYARKDKSGTISVEHNGNEYKLNYYFILPDKEEDWAKDGECKNIFKQINVHLDPIIYTVNGQYITGERFTKLKNAGLSFLQYRLLVDIDLDVLGKDKYKFFTSDRSRIQDSDLTNGFLDKVIDALKEEKIIREMNDYIASMSVDSNINEDFINDISNNVKNIYSKYLKSGNNLISVRRGRHLNPTDEEIYYDYINTFEITTAKQVFYKNENINLVLTTGAKKSINDKANIYLFIDGKQNYNFFQSVMNGRIQYSVSNIPIGMHNAQFELYDNESNLSKESNAFEFAVVDDIKQKPENINKDKGLNLNIKIVDERELIVDVEKNKEDKSITVYLCLNHDLLVDNIYGRTSNTDEVERIKNELLQPLTLFALFLDNEYDEIESIEKKNDIILSFCNTFYISYMNKLS